MSGEYTEAPVVFISYSHDSREHKQWVAQLAKALLDKHVQVIFDQWDLEPGDDVPKFMERAVKKADRVLMICSEPYVRKANDGKGGVGYEAMIVTGELVRDLGTRKFIPLIRQGTGESVVPDCVSTRLYVDFSKDDDFDGALADLIKTLHQANHLTKPSLGPNPFAGLNTPSPEKAARQTTSENFFEEAVSDPKAAYDLASSIAASGDLAAWRRLLRTLQQKAATDLVAWRLADESVPSSTDKDWAELHEHAAMGVAFYMPLFACLVAGAESGKDEFSGQLGWIDDVLSPAGWNRGGYNYWIDFPQLVLFVGHALVGGMLMEARAGDPAYALATTRITDKYQSRESRPLFLETGVTGWPESMRNCTVAWAFLTKLIDEQPWISSVFGSPDHAKSGVSAYYQLLSFLNFCRLSVKGRFESGELEWPITVPLNFCKWDEKVASSGYRTFLGQRALLVRLLEANDLANPDKFRTHWKLWLELCGKWFGNVFHWHFRRELPQENLPADLENKGLSLADL